MTKKLLALLLAVLTITALASCGKNKEKEDLNKYKEEEVIFTSYTDETGTYHFESLDSDSVAIIGYSGSDVPHAVSIPATVKTGEAASTVKNVTAIADNAFYAKSNITSVVIPEGVKTIGEFAFAMCVQLTSVSLPSSLTTLGTGAFMDTALTSLSIPAGSALKEIPKLCYSRCEKLTEVVIPAFIETVGESAFFGCTGITKVTVSEGVKVIGKQAFQNTTALADLTLPASLTNTDPLEDLAFAGSALDADHITCPAGSAAEAYVDKMFNSRA